jgi:hypothetical protein
MKAPSESTLRLAFAAVVSPAARLMRLLGVDLLGLKREPQARTYWKTRSGARARIDMTSKS